tara:strand:- start:523 stop:756 length:234 start_codon:yes stop_codon:yes gene_type:complete
MATQRKYNIFTETANALKENLVRIFSKDEDFTDDDFLIKLQEDSLLKEKLFEALKSSHTNEIKIENLRKRTKLETAD